MWSSQVLCQWFPSWRSLMTALRMLQCSKCGETGLAYLSRWLRFYRKRDVLPTTQGCVKLAAASFRYNGCLIKKLNFSRWTTVWSLDGHEMCFFKSEHHFFLDRHTMRSICLCLSLDHDFGSLNAPKELRVLSDDSLEAPEITTYNWSWSGETFLPSVLLNKMRSPTRRSFVPSKQISPS